MAIYVTGDVHGRAEYGASRVAFRSWPLGRTLTSDDVVIVAGDFGFVWDGSNAERYWLDWFESKPWTTCFVDGNHENHRMLAELPVREWNGGLVHEVRPRVLHLMRGEVFDIDGLAVLAMGGAASNDRQYRREGRSWWPEEMPSEEEMDRYRADLQDAKTRLHTDIIAGNAPDLFGAMLVTGVLAHIAIQVVLNIAVVTNVIPNTGITLPFISYGGTSVLFLMIEMGMVLSVSNQIRLEQQ